MKNESVRTLLLSVLYLLSALPLLRAQGGGALDEGVGGIRYLITLPDTVANMQDVRYPDTDRESFLLMVYSSVDQEVTIGYPGDVPRRISVNGGELIEVDLREYGVPIIDEVNRPELRKGLEVRSADPIVLYVLYATRFGTAGFTPLPVEAWGKRYVVGVWPGEVVHSVPSPGGGNPPLPPEPAPAEIVIIAVEDNTEVTISPTDELFDCQGCTTVMLDAGETYQVRSVVRVDAGGFPVEWDAGDITGTLIEADRPVAVICGNTRASLDTFSIPVLAGNSGRDLAMEWISPVDLHGDAFAFVPTEDEVRSPILEDGRQSELLRVVATGETDVRISPDLSAGQWIDPVGGSLEAQGFAEWRESDLTRGREVLTDRPTLALQGIPAAPRFDSTVGEGNFIGAAYTLWGSAVVELVPRYRWGTMAPFRLPSLLPQMVHRLVVVSDSMHRSDIYLEKEGDEGTLIELPHSIPGTDLVWGSLEVESDVSYMVRGREGARFTGRLQGSAPGFEKYRPVSLGLSHHQENVASTYAMPLVSLSTGISSVSTDPGVTEPLLHDFSFAPATGLLQFRYRENREVSGEVMLLDLQGREVRGVPIHNESGSVRIDLSGLSSGYYWVRLRVAGQQGVRSVLYLR